METVLIVEDKESMREMLREALKFEGYNVVLAKDGDEGIKKIRAGMIDVVLTDMKLPKKDGLEVLKASKNHNPLVPVVVMTAYGSVEVAVSAMKLGAYDFLTKPLDIDHLTLLIKRSLANQKLVTENILLKEMLSDRIGTPRIIGKSQNMIAVAESIQKVSRTKTTVLLLGESGTGKELFARAIHDLSDRQDRPFIAINCASIPGELLESELFGYEKGAFTGAADRKIGRLELASGGTVFLDEIGEMDMALQSKVLRVLQEGEIDRVGGCGPVKIDIRIIAASNRNLESAVEEKTFREDLFYRLNVFPIVIPPLRERKEDIPALIEHFISKYAPDMNLGHIEVSPPALDILTNYHWKGNVRELENVIERALILCDGKEIKPDDLRLSSAPSDSLLNGLPMDGTLDDVAKKALRIAEGRRIKKALDETHGNKTRAAEMLKVSYKTLLTKIKEYGIMDKE